MTDNSNILKSLRSDNQSVRNRMLETIYVEYYPVIKSYIADNNGNAKDAEDVFQDAIVVFYQKARNVDFTLNCTVKTYLYSICKNLWLNKLRVNSRYSNLDDQIGYMPISADTLALATIDERYSMVQKHFGRMGQKCKEVLYNFYFHRMSMHSIAQELNFANEQVAKNKKSRCLKKLKSLIRNNKSTSDRYEQGTRT